MEEMAINTWPAPFRNHKMANMASPDIKKPDNSNRPNRVPPIISAFSV